MSVSSDWSLVNTVSSLVIFRHVDDEVDGPYKTLDRTTVLNDMQIMDRIKAACNPLPIKTQYSFNVGQY